MSNATTYVHTKGENPPPALYHRTGCTILKVAAVMAALSGALICLAAYQVIPFSFISSLGIYGKIGGFGVLGAGAALGFALYLLKRQSSYLPLKKAILKSEAVESTSLPILQKPAPSLPLPPHIFEDGDLGVGFRRVPDETVPLLATQDHASIQTKKFQDLTRDLEEIKIDITNLSQYPEQLKKQLPLYMVQLKTMDFLLQAMFLSDSAQPEVSTCQQTWIDLENVLGPQLAKAYPQQLPTDILSNSVDRLDNDFKFRLHAAWERAKDHA